MTHPIELFQGETSELTQHPTKKRTYTPPKLDDYGEIRNVTLGIPTPSGESGNIGTHRI